MKTRIIALVLIIIGFVFVVGSIIVSKNSIETNEIADIEEMPGFTRIDSVQGIAFFVNSQFVDRATAITQVSDSISFQKNQFYSYKNGVDKYLLFNIENLIVVAEKGTDFGIADAADKPFALQNASMMNIWFTQGSKKFNSVTENGVTTTIACAGVGINSKTYGDFCGKLINVYKDGEEWSLFVGVPGPRYDKISDNAKKGIDTIVNTLTFSNSANLLAQDIYAVSLSGDDSTKTQVETEIIEITDGDGLNLSNQNSIVDKEEDKAYTSTPYNMLMLGDNGIFSAFNDYELMYEEPIICPINVYRGEEAVNLIKEFCSTTGQYDYFNAPEGSSWEVIEYNLNYKHCNNYDYANIRLKGLDGETLKYRGIKYTPRTYDMLFKAKESENSDWITNLYTYYAVPNGCYEYCIEVGEDKSVIPDIEVNAAYYHIINDNHKEENVLIQDENNKEDNIESINKDAIKEEEEISTGEPTEIIENNNSSTENDETIESSENILTQE